MITLVFRFNVTHEELETVECPAVPRVGDRITFTEYKPTYDERERANYPVEARVTVYLDYWNPTEARLQETE